MNDKEYQKRYRREHGHADTRPDYWAKRRLFFLIENGIIVPEQDKEQQ